MSYAGLDYDDRWYRKRAEDEVSRLRGEMEHRLPAADESGFYEYGVMSSDNEAVYPCWTRRAAQGRAYTLNRQSAAASWRVVRRWVQPSRWEADADPDSGMPSTW